MLAAIVAGGVTAPTLLVARDRAALDDLSDSKRVREQFTRPTRYSLQLVRTGGRCNAPEWINKSPDNMAS